jgi:hypothetical protein
MEPVTFAHIIMFRRYRDILREKTLPLENSNMMLPSHLLWMCETMITNLNEKPNYPIDKAARWLGYIQGVLSATGKIDPGTERDFSRPLFRAAYGEKVAGEL